VTRRESRGSPGAFEDIGDLPGLVNKQKAIENGHLGLIFPFKIVSFHSYVSLPAGSYFLPEGNLS
jgi:hypothetical protein